MWRWLLELNPLDAGSHRGFARCLAGLRRWPEALRVFRMARLMLWLILSAFLVAANWLLAVLHASRDTKAVLAERRKHFSG